MHISDACNGTGITLAGDEGHVWMNAPLYKDNIYCQWQIYVEFGKVSIAYSPSEIYLNRITAVKTKIQVDYIKLCQDKTRPMTYFSFWRVTNMSIFWKRYAVSTHAINARVSLFAWQPLCIFKMPIESSICQYFGIIAITDFDLNYQTLNFLGRRTE